MYVISNRIFNSFNLLKCKTKKRSCQCKHGPPMEQTRGLFCTCISGVALCQSQHQSLLANEFDVPIIYPIWDTQEGCFAHATQMWLAVNYMQVSLLANEFHVRIVLHGQVSLAAVNQVLCNSWGHERLWKSKELLKDCFENVNICLVYVLLACLHVEYTS